MSTRVGILGIGVQMPDEVRANDWWPPDVVAQWKEKAAQQAKLFSRLEPRTEGQRHVLELMHEGLQDPFQGAETRHVIASGQTAAELEVAASQEALRNAGVAAADIDLLVTYTACPEVLATNQACTVHEALDLPERGLTLSIDASCNSFLQQLDIATAQIRAGRARAALLVQSCTVSRILPYAEPFSAWFGDGATAVVVGPVTGSHGLQSVEHRTDGSLQGSLVATVPGANWFDDGRAVVHPANPLRGQRLFLESADTAADSIRDALQAAELDPADVQFFACHQGTAWIRRAIQQTANLKAAATLDTFPWAASLSAANTPLVLYTALRRDLLSDGDAVVIYSGGSGITSSAAVLRWGH